MAEFSVSVAQEMILRVSPTLEDGVTPAFFENVQCISLDESQLTVVADPTNPLSDLIFRPIDDDSEEDVVVDCEVSADVRRGPDERRITEPFQVRIQPREATSLGLGVVGYRPKSPLIEPEPEPEPEEPPV